MQPDPRTDGVTVPILPSRDIPATLDFYARLGFEALFATDGPEGYAILRRGGMELHFFAHPGLDPQENDAGAYVHALDVGALHAAWEAAAPGLLSAPVDTPWGMRECHFWDGDRNLIRIGQPSAAG